jgi:diadenosine tetraphosphatase ApaH/serine/threonine PP2A family protein phosphatase
MFAVVSDIHGNLEALDAVLADIARQGIVTVYCLGDLVGYGPNPVECIERATKWEGVLLGNFDHALLVDDFDGWGSSSAVKSVTWQRPSLLDSPQFAFLNSCPRTHREGDFLFVHGTPRNPLNEYLFPEDLYNPSKMAKVTACFEQYCFCGHTHVPGVFVEPEEAGGQWEFFSPQECNHFWRFDGRKTIINAGSVGQPRDGDRRACYVIVDGWDVTFHRVEYDVDATVAKVYATPELDNFLGDRLREGR